MGLTCCVCGSRWMLDRPLLYHGDKLHCDSHACSRGCSECEDWDRALENNEKGAAQPVASPCSPAQDTPTPAPAPAGSFTKAPGYMAMMAKIKGGR